MASLQTYDRLSKQKIIDSSYFFIHFILGSVNCFCFTKGKNSNHLDSFQQYLCVNSTKVHLYKKNFKTLRKIIEENNSKMEIHPVFILSELIGNICIIKAIYRINAVLTKISTFFTRTLKKKILKCIKKHKRLQIAKQC